MTPKEINGLWWIDYRDSRGELRHVGPFDTNAAAWRWIERHEGEPVSASEKRAEFGFTQSGRGTGL